MNCKYGRTLKAQSTTSKEDTCTHTAVYLYEYLIKRKPKQGT